MVRAWAPYIAIAGLVGAAAAVATIVVIDGFGGSEAALEPAAVAERKADSGPNPEPGPEPWPVRSTAEIKADRLAAPPPPPKPSVSMFLDTARQFMVASVVAPAPPPARPTTALLDDQQIAAIKARLKLTATQEKYWPPVESALRDVISAMHVTRRQPSSMDADNESVKRLMAAAGPFLAQLRADQKSQIQSLMRLAGLGTQLPSAN
ncbi:hypothetical protein AFIC_002181 [[Pseudomonas] carboxydohydrogena]|uniref:Uncharacterized protein n=1 Tax=Afipia carboxydohydrogena TaxID=290 RepID=A0ABY8BMC5_AFICR|nr:hypothetical protein [[Pseudomonas] carboxydohydrogena]WEF50636.1 hypothetical protein AFIC_002181 [[Pseudomonas] carboxydohydrogena]